MQKNEIINILNKEGIKYVVENSVIYIYLAPYTKENISNIKNKFFKQYKGSVGFRPLERLTGVKNEENSEE